MPDPETKPRRRRRRKQERIPVLMHVEVRADFTLHQQHHYVAAITAITTDLLNVRQEQVRVTLAETSPAERAWAERHLLMWTGC